MARYQIVIEGTNEQEMQGLFEEIQNNYNLYDNCVVQEVTDEESIIDTEDRCVETGNIMCERPVQCPFEPPDFPIYDEDEQEAI